MASHSHSGVKPWREWLSLKLRAIVLYFCPGLRIRRPGFLWSSGGVSVRVFYPTIENPNVGSAKWLMAFCRMYAQEHKLALSFGRMSEDLLRLGYPEMARHSGKLAFDHWRRSQRLAEAIGSDCRCTRSRKQACCA